MPRRRRDGPPRDQDEVGPAPAPDLDLNALEHLFDGPADPSVDVGADDPASGGPDRPD